MNEADILVIGVNYNTWDETLRWLASINDCLVPGVRVILADNSDKPEPDGFRQRLEAFGFAVCRATGTNAGYFGGARPALEEYLAAHPLPRFVVLSNVDILFKESFFATLSATAPDETTAILAPSIRSARWGADYNPQRMQRYSRARLVFLLNLYRCRTLHNLYILLSYGRKWLSGRRKNPDRPRTIPADGYPKIYAAHGSCLVFTRAWFERGGSLEMPVFLFGEEIILAETVLAKGMEIRYRPDLVIEDHEHASVGLFASPAINRHYYDSVRIILEKFY